MWLDAKHESAVFASAKITHGAAVALDLVTTGPLVCPGSSNPGWPVSAEIYLAVLAGKQLDKYQHVAARDCTSRGA